MIIWITEKELEENGFYCRIHKERGKIVEIIVENKKKMYKECLEVVRRMKEL